MEGRYGWTDSYTYDNNFGGVNSALWCPKKEAASLSDVPPQCPGNGVLVQSRAAAQGHSKLYCPERVGEEKTTDGCLLNVKGCHVDREEFRLLCSAPITAGVQAEARQQIVAPDNPLISANDELFSDAKWSSGLREWVRNGKAPFQLEDEMQTRLLGGSSRQRRRGVMCGWVGDATLQSRASRHPISQGRASGRAHGRGVPPDGLPTSSISKRPSCIVSTVTADKLSSFLANVREAYYQRSNRSLAPEKQSLFATKPGGGALVFLEAWTL